MRAKLAEVPSAPRLLAFHLGTLAQGEAFFAEHAPEVCAVSDPKAFFYEAFGHRRAGLGQLFGLGVLSAGFRAMRAGHSVGRPVGDPIRMSGIILLDGRSVVEELIFRHAGDHSGLPGLFERIKATA